MRIGVYVGDHSPNSGGGYTFVNSVLSALSKLENFKHTIVFLGEKSAISEYRSALSKNAAFEFLVMSELSAFERIGARLRRFSALMESFFCGSSVWDDVVEKNDLDIIWFVGGGAYEPPPCPYIATVWDVQHRTHPWFPEVSLQGEWVSREYSLRRFLNRATYVITGTKTGSDQLVRYFQLQPSCIRLLPHPTPDWALNAIEVNDVLDKTSAYPKGRYLFYPAQFWPHKNHVNLLLALKYLKEEHDLRFELILCGSDKGNKAYVVESVERLGLAEQVHFLGFISIEDMVDLYQNAFALVYPSFSGPENLPPLEAFSLKCPVLISNYEGAKEQLNDAALYFDPCDPVDMGNRILELMVSQDLRRELLGRGELRSKKWKSSDYLMGALNVITEFEAIRRTWR